MNKQSHPLSYQLLTDWIKKQSKIAGQPQELLDKLPVENMTDMVLSSNGQVLREFLDEQRVYTGVWPVEDTTTGTVVWKWKVVGKGPTTDSSCLTRKEAETKVFEEGMKRLEGKLA